MYNNEDVTNVNLTEVRRRVFFNNLDNSIIGGDSKGKEKDKRFKTSEGGVECRVVKLT